MIVNDVQAYNHVGRMGAWLLGVTEGQSEVHQLSVADSLRFPPAHGALFVARDLRKFDPSLRVSSTIVFDIEGFTYSEV